jgi:hypothetical protein
MLLIVITRAIIYQASFYYSVGTERLVNMEHTINIITIGKIIIQFGYKTPLPGFISPSTIIISILPPYLPQLFQDNTSTALVVSTIAFFIITLPPPL